MVIRTGKHIIQVLLLVVLAFAPATGALGAALREGGELGSEQVYLPLLQGGGDAVAIPERVAGEIIVAYHDEVVAASVNALYATYGASVVGTLPQLRAQVLSLPEEQSAAALAELNGQEGVAYAEPNYIASGGFVPNDPYYASYQYGPRIINAEAAWDITRGDGSVLVAVLDSGADFGHPDLVGKLVAGYDYVNRDGDPSDDHGHGTHVSGIVAGVTDNGTGIASVGGEVRVLVMKVLSSQNTGSYSNIAQAIMDAADQGVRVINLSLGGSSASLTLQNAVQYAWAQGVLVVAAAGNNGSSVPFYPAAYAEVMGVTMTNWTDSYVSLSNYGEWVSVAAPGYSIQSTDWSGGVGAYAMRTGTSQAAPHVTGVAALAWSVNGGLSAEQVRGLIESSADDLGAAGFDPYYGHGRVNAYSAVVAAQGLVVEEPQPTNTPEPTPTNTPEPEPTATNTPEPEPEPTALSIHVGDLDGASAKWGKEWQATVQVRVVDTDNDPVTFAAVNGNWSNGYSGPGGCTTDGAGWCSVSTQKINKRTSSVQFSITGIDHDTASYLPGGNSDHDGDSDGTTVVVGKP